MTDSITADETIAGKLNAMYRIKEEVTRSTSGFREVSCVESSKPRNISKYAWGKKKPMFSAKLKAGNRTMPEHGSVPDDMFSKYIVAAGTITSTAPNDAVHNTKDIWKAFREELTEVQSEQDPHSSSMGVAGMNYNRKDGVEATASPSKQTKATRKVFYHPSVISGLDGTIIEPPSSIIQDARLVSGAVPVVFECRGMKTRTSTADYETSYDEEEVNMESFIESEYSVESGGGVSAGSSVSYPTITLPSIVPKINTACLTPFNESDLFELNLS